VLYAIGLGLDVRAHISNEAIQTLKSCRVVYVLSPDSLSLELIQALSPTIKVVDCSPYYNAEDLRPNVYENIARDIINEADNYTNIGIAVYGNPMFLVSAVERIIEKAESKGIKTKVIPAISSFDTLLADLKIDLGYGVTLIDASLLVSTKPNIDARLPLLIFQVANIGSNKVERGEIHSSRLEPLIDYLKTIYPENHECKIIVSSKGIFDPGYIADLRISELSTSDAISLSHRPTIYIPEMDV
tara:strand:- start:3599 stop:4330 length:732 start_codon:yes stop_codon:yes gene_type:complete